MMLNDLDISINYRKLNLAQKMTIHVALQSFAMDLNVHGLGEDENGKQLTKNYLASIDEINKMIQQS